ncbi:hypothetical protein [Glaciibacter psychrotolerans]|uniref:DUF1376 domain-containing protein n=1 Tax=Glaciibacter psychrotolerans TaxID=670054 RepID=A0A7Z0EE09_9MICO|nr:hypothetical protein [Leifsonia psychrotolerans]NYJ19172.1 hypothetical protein [Leifsonia psychrotolerans]
MPWFKVDDGFHGHPKVVDLSMAAIGLWTVAGSWCAKYLTDGFVPDRTVTRLGGSPDEAAELVKSVLWDAAEGGYQFKDWEDYQPLKEEVEAERLAAQERMKKVRAAKRGVRANKDRTDDERSGEQPANVRDVFGRSSEEVRVAPSHPIPSHPSTSKEVDSSPAVSNYSTEFAQWWEVYPRKASKADAAKAFTAARKTTDLATLTAGAQSYALLNIGQDKSLLKFPAGWLRSRRWEDEDQVAFTPDKAWQPSQAPIQHHVARPADCPIHANYPMPCDSCARDRDEGREF